MKLVFISYRMHSFWSISLIILAGLPPIIEYAGKDFVTTEPAATTHPWPKHTPDKIIDPTPIHTS